MPLDPAGQWPALSTTEPAGSRENTRTGLHPRVVAREFDRLFRARGIDTHPALVREMARRWVTEGHERLPDENTPLWYPDPTGATAVRHVLWGGGDRAS